MLTWFEARLSASRMKKCIQIGMVTRNKDEKTEDCLTRECIIATL